ncbi:MAG: regulatory protein RecX [bacterium]
MFKVTRTTKPESLNAAKSYAFKLLSRRSYSKAELKKRLFEKGFDLNVCLGTLQAMEEYGYINDPELAAREMERYLKERYLGPRRIEQRLRQRGIDVEIVNQVMGSVDTDLVQRLCLQEARRKLGTLSHIEPQKKLARLGNYLLRRGYDLESVNCCLRELF